MNIDEQKCYQLLEGGVLPVHARVLASWRSEKLESLLRSAVPDISIDYLMDMDVETFMQIPAWTEDGRYDFIFDNGQATFKPSALWRSMVDGTPIVLDEINLLPFDSLRFLQTILDGKAEFLYKGNTVKIADGFKIIGTMNLTVNGMTYGLPEPLVDRAEDMQKFTLSAKDLLKAII